MRWSSRSRRALAAALVLGHAAPGAAQVSERSALDSVVSVDAFAGENVSSRPQIIVDVSAGLRVSEHVQLFVRPWFRLPRPTAPGGPAPAWSRELYAAGIRYERPGAIAARVDVGYNVSPIGLGIMDTRPSLNPVIGTHLSYVSPMPAFEAGAPRVSPIAASYPLGAQVTISSDRWDARGAVLTSAPTRIYAVGRPTNPRQTPAYVAGAGITPRVGLRIGGSVAHGDYATAAELPAAAGSGRSVTIAGAEAEYAFGYTKLSGEVVASRFERASGAHAVSYQWFAQGMHTLTPRWFVAGRHESTLAPALATAAAGGRRPRLAIVETAVGFRVTPGISLRTSYYTRKSYGSSAWDRQAAVSAVWARRWR